MSVQRTLDDLGTPLADVTFVVLDLETTGGSPSTCAITEVGAVKVRGGEVLGTLQTLVNPGVAIPASITYLTGITQAMVLPAPTIDEVLGPLLAFIGSTVIVGHNVRFDLAFLRAATERHGWPRLSNLVVDTCALARRLVRDEVPNCKLSTLARHLRATHPPTHRAMDDALATVDVLHALLERAGAFGVLGLDDLISLPTVKGHPQLSKLKLVARLPRAPGVYLFRDASGRILYVGKAVDLRRRVRSYFSSDDRRKVGALLREAATLDHIVCHGELEASVLEVRLIHQHAPRYNRRTKQWRSYAYLKLTLAETYPRLSIVRVPRPQDGNLYLGPFPSAAAARTVAEAIESALPLRRCTGRPGRTRRESPCAPAQLGVATCPCAGGIDPDGYARIVAQVVLGLTQEPSVLLDPLRRRMGALAACGRYEEAADTRDRAAALARALARQRRVDALRRAGHLHLVIAGEGQAVVDGGVLRAAWTDADDPPSPELTFAEDPTAPLARELADEVGTIASWLEAKAAKVRIIHSAAGWAWPLPRLPSFEPARAPVG